MAAGQRSEKRTKTGRHLVASSCLYGLLAVCSLPVPTRAFAEEAKETRPVTARITLGSHEGAAHPMKTGHATTGGGTIDITQPAPDTLVVTMSGNVASSSGSFTNAQAAIDFFERVQFQVEFSEPGHSGKLYIHAKVQGLLRGHGKNAVAGMEGANATLMCGPHELATLALPQRMVGDCDALAVNAAQGPICVPAFAGCYELHQSFRIAASQGSGVLACSKASAEFSPSALPDIWTGQSYPFKNVDKSDLGYQLVLRVVPSVANGESFTTSSRHPSTSYGTEQVVNHVAAGPPPPSDNHNPPIAARTPGTVRPLPPMARRDQNPTVHPGSPTFPQTPARW